MSTPASPEPTLRSLQERLKSLHKRRYNLDAHILFILQEVRATITHYHFLSMVVFERRLVEREPINSWQNYPFVAVLNPQELNGVILRFWSDLMEMVRWMYGAMRAFRDLRKVGEYE